MSEDEVNILSVEKRETAGKPPHCPTESSIKTARAMASVGVQTKFIAAALEISEPTLIKYYSDEMNNARGKAHMQVGNSLFQRAIAGDTPSAIFYAKTQMGWKEPKTEEDNKGTNTVILSNVSDKELDARISELLKKR